ncbi:hypothetical protein [Ekhidna sp.]|jgi:hypothetical protein|uniref:hypothetical protein n=1 Tax=Ekhidna sp. TaxID=2608089 RepID=UPI0032EB386A
MSNKNTLRPVEVQQNGKKIKGYFHRFVYSSSNYCSVTQVLIELEDGRLRFFDPYFVRFADRETKRDILAKSPN